MQWFCFFFFQTSINCKGEQAAKPLLAQFMTVICSQMTGKMQYMTTNRHLPLTALEGGQKRTKSANYCGFSTQCLPLFLVVGKKYKLLQTSSSIKTTVCFSKKSKQLATIQTKYKIIMIYERNMFHFCFSKQKGNSEGITLYTVFGH